VLNQHQLHTLLQCPCPTLVPQATYPIPSANTYLGGIATGADHNVWITEGDADKIARITESGTVTDYPVEPGGYPALIEPGPDGNLWFTDYTLNTIHRVTTSGVITNFPLPAYDLTNGNLQGIAAGPDGNMWFAHNGANLIGVMSTSGTLLVTYQIPTPNSGVDFIV